MIVEFGPYKAREIKGCAVAVLYVLLLCSRDRVPLILRLILMALFSVYIMIWMAHISRKIHFTKDGCRISLWRFERFYRWDDIQTRRVKAMGWDDTSAMSTKAVFFCNKRLRKDAWLTPYRYWLRPMSFFYVHFLPEQPLTKREKKRINDFGVDGKAFMDKMAEWGVKLEEG